MPSVLELLLAILQHKTHGRLEDLLVEQKPLNVITLQLFPFSDFTVSFPGFILRQTLATNPLRPCGHFIMIDIIDKPTHTVHTHPNLTKPLS